MLVLDGGPSVVPYFKNTFYYFIGFQEISCGMRFVIKNDLSVRIRQSQVLLFQHRHLPAL